ncbi:type VII secretion integral membrane protein EccD [Nocardioides hwasunensis]|uniref:Type VII secretion integral membrane protein EccD n=2 Tax=Nocardioides hwasunensis TaxID=397258 RepID=A0ABR8MHS4_9ACTN|nr:type VII secretion integral membrane protein EccD [Nocardioides hwasunensis]
MDLAVPLELTVAELMSSLVETLGSDVADQGAAAGGFVLQRSGETALDPSMTLRAAQVRDGEMLHLRMQVGQMPEVAYDDVLEAVADGVLTRSKRWTEEDTARACSWLAALCVGFVLGSCLLAGPSWAAPAAVSGGLALLLVGVSVVLGRAFDRPGTSLVAAGFAIASAFAGGAMAFGGRLTVVSFGADQLLPAAAAAVLVAAVCRVLLPRGVAGFTATIGTGLLAVAGSLAAGVGGLDVAATAAFTAGVALLASPIIPVASFKMSRLNLPIVPTGADDLRAETASVDGTRVLRQAVMADQYMTGIVTALATILGGAAVLLADGDGVQTVLAGVLGGIAALRARLFTGRAQRLSLLLAGAVAGFAVLRAMATSFDTWSAQLALVLGVAILALAMFWLVVVLPGRRYAPPSSRAADIVEALLVLSVLPLILGIMGVYSRIRELVG